MALRLLNPARDEGESGMRYFVILAACGLLCGCEAYGERLQDRYDSLFKTKAQIEAEDTAACQRLGAMPGTDIYVQCMIGRAQIRATNNAAASARANSANLQGGSGSGATTSGLGSNGMACLGQTTQTPYGPRFNCY
jgi:hypothetical protein